MNVVFLCDRYYWEHKMSRGRFDYALAVGNHPDVDLTRTGNGFEGYRNGESVQTNFDRMGLRPDVVWAYKPEDHIQFRECRAAKVVTMNECWWPQQRAKRESEEHGFDLVLCHHENDIRHFDGFSGKVAHIPHCAGVLRFLRPVDESRPVDCLLSGVLSPEHYPLRSRWKQLLDQSRISGRVRNHPGYRLKSEAECWRQFDQYADALKNAKIALCCASRHKYALAKLVEGLLAGCLVISDMPDDSHFRRTLGHCIVPVSPDASDDELCDTVSYWLNADEQRRKRAQMGQTVARDLFSLHRYADRWVNAVREKLGIS